MTRGVMAGVVLVVVIIAGLLALAYFLPRAGQLLIAVEAPQPADVLIILTGNKYRVNAAPPLIKSGYVQKIVISGNEPPEAEYMQKVLVQNGIKQQDIYVESKSASTWQNATAALSIMREHNWKSAIVLTSELHTRRAGLCFRAQNTDGRAITVVPFYARTDYYVPEWYASSNGLRAVTEEWLKMLVYLPRIASAMQQR